MAPLQLNVDFVGLVLLGDDLLVVGAVDLVAVRELPAA